MKNRFLFFTLLLHNLIFAADISITQPQIAMNTSGNAVIEWTQFNGSNFAVYESTLTRGGSVWADPTRVSLNGRDAMLHKLAINENNQVFYIWQRYNGSFFEIEVSFGDFAQLPSVPVTLSRNASFFPKIAVDQDGDATAVWQETFSLGSAFTTSHLTNQDWSDPIQLGSYTNFFIFPSVAEEQTSPNSVAVWQGVNGDATIGIQAAAFDGSSWSPPLFISESGADGVNPQVVYSASGEALAIWQRENNNKLAVQIASFLGGVWQPPTTIGDFQSHLIDPEIAVNATGQVVVVGRHFDGQNSLIFAATRDGGAWSNFRIISQDTNCFNPQVTLNDSGQAIAIWLSTSSGMGVIQTATLVVGDSWTSPVILSDPSLDSANPQVVIDNTGYAISTWQSSDASIILVEASTLPSFGGAWNPPEIVNPDPVN